MCWFVFGEVGDEFFQQGFLGQGFFVVVFGVVGDFLQLFFVVVEVGEDQFEVDDFDVVFGVDIVGYVDYVVVFEVVYYVGDGVGFVDVGEEFVVQVFIFGGVCYQVGDVDEFYCGGQYVFGFDDFGQGVQVCVGYWYDVVVWFDGVEWEVFCCDIGFGQGVEQGGFVDVGQVDDVVVEFYVMFFVFRQVLEKWFRFFGCVVFVLFGFSFW